MPNIAFESERLVIEIDGMESHSDRDAFEADCVRGNHLVKSGWTVLYFTWAMLDDPDWIIRTIKIVRARLRRAQLKAA